MADVITDEMVESLRTARGGFDREALKALGVAWPPKSGWKRRLVGQPVPAAVREILARRRNLAKPDPAPEDPTTFRLGNDLEKKPVARMVVLLSEDAKVCGFFFEASPGIAAQDAAAVAYKVAQRAMGR